MFLILAYWTEANKKIKFPAVFMVLSEMRQLENLLNLEQKDNPGPCVIRVCAIWACYAKNGLGAHEIIQACVINKLQESICIQIFCRIETMIHEHFPNTDIGTNNLCIMQFLAAVNHKLKRAIFVSEQACEIMTLLKFSSAKHVVTTLSHCISHVNRKIKLLPFHQIRLMLPQ